jgi:hypothetical protein
MMNESAPPEPIDNLYDEEIFRIKELQAQLIHRFSETPPTPENLREFEKHVKGRFLDAGFHVELNMVEYLLALLQEEDQLPPPEIVVMGRVDPLEYGFDHEKKGWEVKKHGNI